MARAPNIATGVGNTNRFRRFKPYKPPPVPANYFDPALDAQQRAAQRGFGDTVTDALVQNTRNTNDYGIQSNLLDQATTNENNVYNRNVGLLTKHYQDVATAQGEQANAAGVIPSGGAYLQAQAKRSANQASDQAGLDLAHQQALDPINNQRGQLDLQYGPMAPQIAALLGDLNTPGKAKQAAKQLKTTLGDPGQAGLLGGRQSQDLLMGLTRGYRENTDFGLDIGAEKAYQAFQAGYNPPQPGEPGGRPRNERILGSGQHTRTITVGGVRYTYGPNGKIISKKRVSRG